MENKKLQIRKRVAILIAPLFVPAFSLALAVFTPADDTSFGDVVFFGLAQGYIAAACVGVPAILILKCIGHYRWSGLIVSGLLAGAIVGILTQAVTGQFSELFAMHAPMDKVMIFSGMIAGIGAFNGFGVACLYGWLAKIGNTKSPE